MLAGLQRRAFDEGDLLLQDRLVAGHRDVVRDGIGQPHDVVGDHRAHAGAGARQPPVLHVAFPELPRRRVEDLLARQRRVVQQEGQRVLQLVAEAEGAARLVEGRARPDAAGRGSGRAASD